jgi:hypothetical protein
MFTHVLYTFMSFVTVRSKLAGAYPLDSDTSATGLEQPLIRKVCDSFEGATTPDRERCRLPSNNYITDLGLKRHFVRGKRMAASVAAPRYSILYQPREPDRSDEKPADSFRHRISTSNCEHDLAYSYHRSRLLDDIHLYRQLICYDIPVLNVQGNIRRTGRLP